MIKFFRYRLKLQKAPGLAFLVLLPLLISLGIWQLHRAEEKAIFLEKQARSLSAGPLQLQEIREDDPERLRYQPVEAIGRYDVLHQFLLDNQINGGKAGYFVLTPFLVQGGSKAVLVNRGWVPLNPDRSVLPDISFKPVHNRVEGRINRFPSVGIQLPGTLEPASGWPSVVQVVDSERLAKRLGYSLFHFQIEMDKNLPDGFNRDWQTIKIMPPEQHTAYAIQWFALALTLSVLFIAYSLKKTDD